MRVAILVFVATALGATGASAGPAEGIRLESVSVHLFLEKSGALSRDITTMKDFHSWDFVPFGDGIPEGERFDDILIKIALGSAKEIFAKGRQGEISLLSGENGKPVETRAIQDVYLKDGKSYRAFYVSGVACKPLVLMATVGGKTVRKDLPFRCGE
jgi:hypothetical protein